jgi:NADH-quinone oxidoreductase subunit C
MTIAELFRENGALSLSQHDLHKEGLTVSAFLPACNLVKCAQALKALDYSLLDISTLETQEGLVVTYHLDNLHTPGRVAIRVLVKAKNPHIPSIYSVFQGAEWHERESFDFFGLIFDQNPNLIPLLLPDDLDGPPPLKKSPADLAPLNALGLWGQAEILDPAFGETVGFKGV